MARPFRGSASFPKVAPFKMKAHNSNYMHGVPDNFQLGDKLILPSSTLRRLTTAFQHRDLPTPLVFEIKNTALGRTSHCGVLQFDGPEAKAIIPNWLMENLYLQDGAAVQLTLRSASRLTFAKFQPHSAAFSRIPDPKTTLPHLFRHTTCLTVGDEITIKHGVNEYALTVMELKPKPFGTLIDTNLTVDFEAPKDGGASSADAVVTELKVGEEFEGHAAADTYAYFRVKVPNQPVSPVRFELASSKGDADLYISMTEMHPTADSHTWVSRSTGTCEVLVDAADEKREASGWFYIGVMAYKADATFKLKVEEKLDLALLRQPTEDAKRQALGRGYSLATDVDEPSNPDDVRCDSCYKWIPKAGMQMHSLRCARTNWRCGVCGLVMQKNLQATHTHCADCGEVIAPTDMEKHMDLVHAGVTCGCGFTCQRSALRAHQKQDCPLRMVTCRWCAVHVAYQDKAQHEDYCGSKTVPCDICGKPVMSKRMINHKAIEHNVNPCVDEHGNLMAPTGSPMASPLVQPSQPVPNLDADTDDSLAAAIAASLQGRTASVGHGTASVGSPEEDALAKAIAESMEEKLAMDAAISRSLGQSVSPGIPAELDSKRAESSSSGLGHQDDVPDDFEVEVEDDWDEDHEDDAIFQAAYGGAGSAQAATASPEAPVLQDSDPSSLLLECPLCMKHLPREDMEHHINTTHFE